MSALADGPLIPLFIRIALFSRARLSRLDILLRIKLQWVDDDEVFVVVVVDGVDVWVLGEPV